MIKKIKLPLAVAFGILSAYLLRDSFIGLSWVVFFSVLAGFHFIYKGIPLYRYKLAKLMIFIVSLISVLIYGQTWPLFLTFISFFGLVADSSPRFTAYMNDVLLSFGQMFRGVPQLLQRNTQPSSSTFLKKLNLFLIPAGLVILFLLFYTSGNQFFGEAVGNSFAWIGDFLSEVFGVLDFQWWVLFFFGVLFISAAINQVKPGVIVKHIDELPLELSRKKTRRPQALPYKKALFDNIMALKQEKNIGVIALVSLNVLLLIVNGFDFLNIYNQLDMEQVNYSRFVHQGTYHLIFAIVVAALIIIFYFRGNLNFYKENKLLKNLAYIWIGQNVILCLNVGLRNLHYVLHTNALTDKRIGVFIFLLIVIIGLTSLFMKVRFHKSLTWLVKLNAFSVVVVISALQLVNMERFMIDYNFSNLNPGDIEMRQIFDEIDYDLVYLDKKIQTTEGLNYSKWGNKVSAYEHWNWVKSHYYKTYEESSSKFWTWHKHQNLKELNFEDSDYSAANHYH